MQTLKSSSISVSVSLSLFHLQTPMSPPPPPPPHVPCLLTSPCHFRYNTSQESLKECQDDLCRGQLVTFVEVNSFRINVIVVCRILCRRGFCQLQWCTSVWRKISHTHNYRSPLSSMPCLLWRLTSFTQDTGTLYTMTCSPSCSPIARRKASLWTEWLPAHL